MPSFGRFGDLHLIGCVTGPSHVWLGVRFTSKPARVVPEVVARPALGDCDHGELAIESLVAAVVDGASEFGLYPVRIEYVANDSPDYALYRRCAALLAERAATECS